MSRAPRRPTEEELALWRSVTESARPLRRRKTVHPEKGEPSPVAGPPARLARKASAAPLAATPVVVPPTKPVPPPLASLTKKMRSRVARGASDIDARLDLHGLTQARAHEALARFLARAQREDARLVIVITGKGRGSSGEGGVLQRQVPQWLSLPEFRPLVIGFETAAPAHGGAGALYVRIRRARA